MRLVLRRGGPPNVGGPPSGSRGVLGEGTECRVNGGRGGRQWSGPPPHITPPVFRTPRGGRLSAVDQLSDRRRRLNGAHPEWRMLLYGPTPCACVEGPRASFSVECLGSPLSPKEPCNPFQKPFLSCQLGGQERNLLEAFSGTSKQSCFTERFRCTGGYKSKQWWNHGGLVGKSGGQSPLME